jgi:hypothetical protein
LCKGGWIFAEQKDWGIVAFLTLTIPPTSLSLGHLPLHKGGFFVGKRYASIVDDEKSAFEQGRKHQQNGHKNPATSIIVEFTAMGGQRNLG